MSEKKDILKDFSEDEISVVNKVDQVAKSAANDIVGTVRTDEVNEVTGSTVVDVKFSENANILQEENVNDIDDSIPSTSSNVNFSENIISLSKRTDVIYESIKCRRNIDTEHSEDSKTKEDEPDTKIFKSIKKLLTRGSGKSNVQDEDHTQYGFVEQENRLGTTERIVENYGFKETKSEIQTKETFTTNPFGNTMVRHIEPRPLQESFVKLDPNRYDFSHRKRGYMITIVNDQFIRDSERKGAHLDLPKIQDFARMFEFQILNDGEDMNVTKEGTLKLLKRVQEMDHSECDCFAFMISSHGGQEKRYNRAEVKTDFTITCSDSQNIFISDIWEMFSDTNCPTLKDKPKIFIVQACRGDSRDYGCDLSVLHPGGRLHKTHVDSFGEADALPLDDSLAPQHTTGLVSGENVRRYPNQYIKNVPTTPNAVIETPSLKCGNDMLILYAIPPGMLAWRNESTGSWMIDCFHQVMMAYDLNTPKSFLSLLTKVSALMSKRSTNAPDFPEFHQKKAVSVIEHALTRDIYFQQKRQRGTMRETYI